MGVTTFETVVNSPIPPEKLFNAGVTDIHKHAPHVPHGVKSPKIVNDNFVFHEDSVFKGMKHRVEAVDKNNFTYTYVITECENFMDGLESISIRTKLEPSASGGSVCKNTTTLHTKAGAQITKEQFKDGEKEMLELFKALEAQLLANPNA